MRSRQYWESSGAEADTSDGKPGSHGTQKDGILYGDGTSDDCTLDNGIADGNRGRGFQSYLKARGRDTPGRLPQDWAFKTP